MIVAAADKADTNHVGRHEIFFRKITLIENGKSLHAARKEFRQLCIGSRRFYTKKN